MAFIIEIPELARLETKLTRAPAMINKGLETAIKVATIVMQSIAKSQAPVRTGKLRSAISAETDGLTGIVYPDLKRAEYSFYVHEGTGIFGKNRTPIVPKEKKVLATKINPGFGQRNAKGYFIIGRRSIGQRPNPYMKRAAQLGGPKVITILKDAVKLAIKDA